MSYMLEIIYQAPEEEKSMWTNIDENMWLDAMNAAKDGPMMVDVQQEDGSVLESAKVLKFRLFDEEGDTLLFEL